MVKNCIYLVIILFVLSVAFPGLCFAESIDGSGPFDDLLIDILEILEGSILTAALIFSVVVFGLSLALFSNTRETIERGGRIVLGLLIAAKGAGIFANALNLSWLI